VPRRANGRPATSLKEPGFPPQRFRNRPADTQLIDPVPGAARAMLVTAFNDPEDFMLATLLQAIEQALGPSLSSIGDIAFWVGILMLAYVVLAPLLRVVVQSKAARSGIEREWIMSCAHCRKITVVAGPECEHCGREFELPWIVRLHIFFGNEGEAHWLRTTRWIYTFAGLSAFVTITVAALISTGAWSPQNNLEELFVGLSLIAWAGLGWLLGRVVGIGTGGPISRIRDAIFSLALATVLIGTATLASAARPVPETVVASIRIDGQVAQMGSKAIALVGYQIGFEYLQVEYDFAGFRRITPLAIVGARRIDLPMGNFESALVDALWEHSNGLNTRGLSVRKHTEQFVANESGTYEIVLRGDKISIRRYRTPPA
jgi:hypothetical protein